MEVLLQILAAPVVIFGMVVDWVYSISVIGANFFGWVFSVLSWFIGVVSGFFSAIFNPVNVSASELQGLVGDTMTGNALEKVQEVVTAMYSYVPDAVWVGVMAFIGISMVWRVLVSGKVQDN